MSHRGAWALVPVKPFETAKSRLAAALSDEARRDLARDLFENTLSILKGAAGLAGVAVVSRDPEVASIALDRGAIALSERSAALDGIVDGALADLARRGAGSALVVLTDLPDLQAKDVERMLDLGERSALVIAPDAQDEGTNALFLSPPDRMPTCFGRRGSFQAHLDRARALGLEAAVLRAPSLAFDLDSTDDLAKLSSRAPSSASRAALRLGTRARSAR
jgi:2-phospho-L-lactate guanylyltransferase